MTAIAAPSAGHTPQELDFLAILRGDAPAEPPKLLPQASDSDEEKAAKEKKKHWLLRWLMGYSNNPSTDSLQGPIAPDNKDDSIGAALAAALAAQQAANMQAVPESAPENTAPNTAPVDDVLELQAEQIVTGSQTQPYSFSLSEHAKQALAIGALQGVATFAAKTALVGAAASIGIPAGGLIIIGAVLAGTISGAVACARAASRADGHNSIKSIGQYLFKPNSYKFGTFFKSFALSTVCGVAFGFAGMAVHDWLFGQAPVIGAGTAAGSATTPHTDNIPSGSSPAPSPAPTPAPAPAPAPTDAAPAAPAPIPAPVPTVSAIDQAQALLGDGASSRMQAIFAAAEQGNPQALKDAAYYLFNGTQGLPQNQDLAIQLYEQAARAGNAQAIHDLAYIRTLPEFADKVTFTPPAAPTPVPVPKPENLVAPPRVAAPAPVAPAPAAPAPAAQPVREPIIIDRTPIPVTVEELPPLRTVPVEIPMVQLPTEITPSYSVASNCLRVDYVNPANGTSLSQLCYTSTASIDGENAMPGTMLNITAYDAAGQPVRGPFLTEPLESTRPVPLRDLLTAAINNLVYSLRNG